MSESLLGYESRLLVWGFKEILRRVACIVVRKVMTALTHAGPRNSLISQNNQGGEWIPQRLCVVSSSRHQHSLLISPVLNNLIFLNSDQKTPGLDISMTYWSLWAHPEKSLKKSHSQYRSKGSAVGKLSLQIDCSDFLVNLCVVLLPNWPTWPV